MTGGLENLSTGEIIALSLGIPAGLTAVYLGLGVVIDAYLKRADRKKELEKKYNPNGDLEMPTFIRRKGEH